METLKLFTPADVAEKLKCTVQWVRKLIASGDLEATPVGKVGHVISRKQLDYFIAHRNRKRGPRQ